MDSLGSSGSCASIPADAAVAAASGLLRQHMSHVCPSAAGVLHPAATIKLICRQPGTARTRCSYMYIPMSQSHHGPQRLPPLHQLFDVCYKAISSMYLTKLPTGASMVLTSATLRSCVPVVSGHAQFQSSARSLLTRNLEIYAPNKAELSKF